MEFFPGNQVLYTNIYGGVLRVGYRRTVKATVGYEKYMKDLTNSKFIVYGAGQVDEKGLITIESAVYASGGSLINFNFIHQVKILFKSTDVKVCRAKLTYFQEIIVTDTAAKIERNKTYNNQENRRKKTEVFSKTKWRNVI